MPSFNRSETQKKEKRKTRKLLGEFKRMSSRRSFLEEKRPESARIQYSIIE